MRTSFLCFNRLEQPITLRYENIFNFGIFRTLLFVHHIFSKCTSIRKINSYANFVAGRSLEAQIDARGHTSVPQPFLYSKVFAKPGRNVEYSTTSIDWNVLTKPQQQLEQVTPTHMIVFFLIQSILLVFHSHTVQTTEYYSCSASIFVL